MLTAGLLVAGVVAAPVAQATPPPAFEPAPIEWAPCESPGLAAAGAECGFVGVPLDYDHPDGELIQLAVSRVLHTSSDEDYQGVLLVNPGGPGGSGLPFSQLQGFVPNDAGGFYDWIGFDPRGVGSSVPALSCIPDYFAPGRPDYQPESGSEEAWLARAEAYAQACATNGGDLLDNLTTVDSVMDMDNIRKALGADQINFYGFSYGTYLGQVYATLYPDNVRRMVLDGVVDPRDVWYQANLNQNVAFETGINIFFEWVAKYDSVYGLGTTGEEVSDLYYAVAEELGKDPAAGVVGPAEWNDLFLAAAYNVGAFTGVAETFAAWVGTGDGEALLAAYLDSTDTTDDNGYAIYLAVECTDAAWPTDWATWEKDNTAVDAIAPFVTWGNAWFNAPCFFWEGEVTKPVEIQGTDTGILILSETLDGATPYEGALQARREFPNSVLIEGVGGTTHSASLSGIPCTDDRIAAYLATGELPERVDGDGSDVQCEPVPQPDPTAVD